MSQLECEQIASFVSDDHPRPAKRRERAERHTEAAIAPVTGLCRKTFVGSMVTAMVVSVFSIVGGIVMANTAVDVYYIPNLGDASIYQAVATPTYLDADQSETASTDAR